MTRSFPFALLLLVAQPVGLMAAELLFPNSDFEHGQLTNWTASGSAFTGRQPTRGDNTSARGNVPCGMQGDFWIGTFENYDGVSGSPGDTRGDGPVGTLTSQLFTIGKPHITFLIGGGNHPGLTGVKLVCEGQEYPMATGADSEAMAPASHDVSALVGKQARIVVFDQATGGWGHINVDDFRASDDPAPDGFRLLPGIPAADAPATGYDQPLRPQFHFTSRRNWLNDPNGMVYDGTLYHLFFQHNPLGTGWGNMTWGHAVSEDMVRWRQVDHALLPYQTGGRSGTVYSGTAVVDHNNSLGLQTGPRPTLAAFFTYASSPFYQALAASTDGGVTWRYHDHGRAVVPNQGFDAGERDPKVFWHEPTGKWVMVLWVANNPGRVRFLTSDDLTNWTFASDLLRDWAFECMDLVFLPVDGNPAQTKCVIYDASFDYEIGTFDGTAFTTEAGPFRAGHGSFYAAQTFNDAPGGRAVQIGWMNGGPDSAAAYGLPFNQQMSFPCDLSLRTTPDGVRLCAFPVPEISSLAGAVHQLENVPLAGSNLLAGAGPLDLVDLEIEFDPGTASEIVLALPRTTVRYHAASRTFTFTDVNGNAGSLVDGIAEPRSGRVRLRLLLDRLSLEGYVFGGEKFGSHYVSPNHGTSSPSLTATGGQGWLHSLAVRKLASAWTPEPPLSTTLANPGFEDGLPGGAVHLADVPGWQTFGGWEGAAGCWNDEGDALSEAAGYPAFTGIGAAALIARGPAEDRAGIYQSLGRVALSDLGRTYTLGADLGARITDGPGDWAHTGALTVSFRKGVTGGADGNPGTLLGTAGVRTVTADDSELPSLASVIPRRAVAVFKPALEDVGTEVFAVIDLVNLSSSPDAAAGERHYIADNVTLAAADPRPAPGPLAYEGFDYPPGPLAGAAGGRGWAGPWSVVNNGTADVVAGSPSAGSRAPAGFDTRSTGNRCHLPNGRRVGRALDTGPGGPFALAGLVDPNGRVGKDGSTVYLSFLQQADGTGLFYELELHRGDLGDPGRIAGIGNDQAGGNVHLRAPNNVHTVIGAGDTALNFYVVRIDFKPGADDVRVYRNPSAATEPATATLVRTNAADLSFDGISFGAFVNGRTVVHDEIRIARTWAVATAENPYTTWARQRGLGGSRFTEDPDGDSLPNGIEWATGGNPAVSGTGPVHSGDAAAGITLGFQRDPDADAALSVQWAASPAGPWNDVPVPDASSTGAGGVVFEIAGDSVTARIPADLASGGRLFARLRAGER